MPIKDAKFINMVDWQEWKPVFYGGIVDNSEPNMIPYHNSPYARNFRVFAGWIGNRPWYYQVANMSGTGAKPYGIWTYENNGMVVGYKSSATSYLTLINPTTYAQTNITTGANITSENRMNFLSGNGAIYCMNWVDIYGKLSWTTYTIPTSGVANFKPSFWAYFSNCGWVSGNPNDPTKVYKSVVNNLDDYNSTGSDKFTFPYTITWLACNQQSLYIFSKYTIDVINTATSTNWISKPLQTTEWCNNHNLAVSVGNGMYYISPSNKIRKIVPDSFGMYDTTELSHRAYNGITRTMELLSLDQSTAFWYAIPSSQIICWHMKSKNATYNDIVIVYNYEYDEWMVDTNKSFSMGILYENIPYTISTINTSLYRDEYGTTDDDAPIQFRYDTKEVDLWDPTAMKTLWQSRLYLSISPNGWVTQRIYADGSLLDERIIGDADIPNQSSGIGTLPVGTYPIGTEWSQDTMHNIFILRDKWQLYSRARKYQWSYSSSTSSKILLQKLSPQIEIKPFQTSGSTFTPR